jgi:hypothetical protein
VSAAAAFCVVMTSASLRAQSATPPATGTSPTPVTITGYVQAQYERAQAETRTIDRVRFRRLSVILRAALASEWSAVVQVDFAQAVDGEHPVVRDAYLRYSGLAASHGLTITTGNQKVPFSRSTLLSSPRRSLVERPFTGERAFGAPGRALGAQVDGLHRDQRIQWSVSVASVLHAPQTFEIRLDGLAEAGDTWNEGVMTTGRMEWHPFGPVGREQGDFARGPFRLLAGASAYVWRNDGDRNPFTDDGAARSSDFADLDRAHAVELSAAVRGRGLSMDGAWSRVSAETIDPTFDGGIYREGRSVLRQTGLEIGYMLRPVPVEILGAVDSLDITSRASIAHRVSGGINWYVNGHRLKFSIMHRESFNTLGVSGARTRTTFVQSQFMF